MKTLKRIFLILILFTMYLFIAIYAYADTVSTDIVDSVFRLHVIANSDSKEDQELKYKVRDAIIQYMHSIADHISTKEEAMELVLEKQDEFYKIAQDVIFKNGYHNSVHIEVGNFPFPTKNYGDISLPAGYYDALKIEIGEAKGQNWWCVMFPSLCFVDVTNGIVPQESKKDLQVQLPTEDYYLISSDKMEYKIKFKLVELLENAKMMLGSKNESENISSTF